MARYEVVIYWSDADNALIAKVPELAGCAADGATPREALANAQVAAREWFESVHEGGRPVPEPKVRLLFACSSPLCTCGFDSSALLTDVSPDSG